MENDEFVRWVKRNFRGLTLNSVLSYIFGGLAGCMAAVWVFNLIAPPWATWFTKTVFEDVCFSVFVFLLIAWFFHD